MRLTIYVTPARLDLSINYPVYHRTGQSSENETKAISRAHEAHLDAVGQRVLSQALALMKMHDILLIRGLTEEEILNAEIALAFSTDSALPEIRSINHHQTYALLTTDEGEILFGARMQMMTQSFVDDHTYIDNTKKRPR